MMRYPWFLVALLFAMCGDGPGEPKSCGAIEACTDVADASGLSAQCAQQHPTSRAARACGLEEETPAGCADLIASAPLLCADGSYRRVTCCRE